MTKREFLQKAVHFLLKTLTHSEYVHAEYLPESGPVLVAINHLSRLDIPLLFDNPRRKDINGLIATKYKKFIFIVPLVWMADAIWLEREEADFEAFRVSVEALKKGIALGISPEGTRSTTGKLLPGKPGTILLAMRSGAPIVPVGLVGTDKGVSDLLHFRKPRMKAIFGPAFTIPPLDRENREAQMQKWTDELMCRIAVLLPESYWGAYADHPRLKELLKEQKSN
jgi:1-acyl-sn-glycerol-3-phosphate acyltransferase